MLCFLRSMTPASPKPELTALDQFDLEISTAFTKQVMNLINDVYFRARLIGFDEWEERNNPDSPLIFVSNHSGMAMPWDAVSFVAMLFRKFDYEYDKTLRTLITPFFTRVGLLSIYQVPQVLTRSGGIEATMQNFEASMSLKQGHVLIYPEGLRGIGKGFENRYELQRVSSSIVRMALKHKTDIVHFASINAEYIHPFAFKSEWLNRMGKRLLGLPFLPLTILLPLILIQPWVFYMAFPANLTFVRKSRIRWQDLTNVPEKEIDEEVIKGIRDRLQDQLQKELNEAEEVYGRSPFGWKSFWRQLKRSYRSFPIWLPIGWPLLFWEFQRAYQRKGTEEMKLTGFSIISILTKQPWLLAYYVPIIGWIPILIWSKRMPKSPKRG